MTTGKTIALTRWTFVGKVMTLLYNMISRLVITFLPRSGKEMQKSKMAVWGTLQIAVKRREVKSKGEKERCKHLNAEPKNSKKR